MITLPENVITLCLYELSACFFSETSGYSAISFLSQDKKCYAFEF